MALCNVCNSNCVHLMDSFDGEGCMSEGFDYEIEQYLYCGDCGNLNQELFKEQEDSRFKTHADIFIRQTKLNPCNHKDSV